MVFDCSFTEYGSYGEMGNAWESMQINSVSVVPEGTSDVESIYSADTTNMCDVSFWKQASFVEVSSAHKCSSQHSVQTGENAGHMQYYVNTHQLHYIAADNISGVSL